jgi:Ca2+-binding RTX toxin-like protein
MTTTPTTWSSETIVNAGNTNGDQIAGETITMLNGRLITVWTDSSDAADTAPGSDVIGQFYDANGAERGLPKQINTYFTAADQTKPEIAALANGGFIVVYEDRGTADGEAASIRYERYNKFGIQVQSGTIESGTIGGSEHSSPSVSVLQDGSVAVTYERLIAGDVDVVTRILDLTDYSLSDRLNAGGNTTDFEGTVETAALGNNLVAIYEHDAGAQTRVEVKVIDTTGSSLSGVVQLAADGSDGHLSALSSTTFAAVWIDGNGLQAQVLNSNGGTVVAKFTVAAAVTNPSSIDVTALKDGGFFVIWKDGAAGELSGQRYDATGAAMGAEVTIATGAAIGHATANLAHDGRILVTFNNAGGEVSRVILDPRDNVINGTDRAEALTSRIDGATVNGLGGNDTIIGMDGDDLLNGGKRSDSIHGGAGSDTINGGTSSDTLDGGIGADSLFGGDENDFLAFSGDSVELGDVANGGNGIDNLLINGTVDLRQVSMVSLEGIEFNHRTSGPKTATITAGQIGNGLAANMEVDSGVGRTDILKIMMGDSLALDMSQFTFSDWEASDRMLVRGDIDAENIRGSRIADNILSRGGADTVNAGGGHDTVNGGAGDDFINGGMGRDRLVGGAGNDTVKGGNGADLLIGGAGVDALRGGRGNDTYVVNAQGEAVDIRNGGIDTVKSSVTYTLGANLENLELVGARNIAGTGNRLDNELTGNDGKNVLNGKGGFDTLTGGAGADKFVFSARLDQSTNVDTITDFETGIDKIRLDHDAFDGLNVGKLGPGKFVIGAAAVDGNDRIIYDSATGDLYFDADGAGGAGQVKFATLDPGLDLKSSDFQII